MSWTSKITVSYRTENLPAQQDIVTAAVLRSVINDTIYVMKHDMYIIVFIIIIIIIIIHVGIILASNSSRSTVTA